MKVGDIVRFTHPFSSVIIGTVVEVGVYTGRKDTKVLWARSGEISTEMSKYLEKVEKRSLFTHFH